MCDRTTLAPKLWREKDGIACQRGRRVRDCSSQLSAGKVHQSSGRSKRCERVGRREKCQSRHDFYKLQNTIVFPPGFLFDIDRARRHSDTIHVASLAACFFPPLFEHILCSKEGERARGGAAYRIGTAPMPPRRRSTSGRFALRAGIGVRFRAAHAYLERRPFPFDLCFGG